MTELKEEKKIPAISFLNKIMNVTSDEWPRIAISWMLQFLYRTGWIIGWTILISMYITRFGILALPYFFIIYALFRMLGAFIYSNYINHFRKDLIILFTAASGALLLFLASLSIPVSDTLLIFIALPTLAVFFSQLYIINSAFIEDLFSPLESERTFPIIESAETIGGITGGLIIAGFAATIPGSKFVYIMIICLLLTIPVILFHRQILKKLPFIHFKKKKHLSKITIDNLKENFSHFKSTPFLKVLLMVVLAQWIFTNLLEFQFTSAVYANISGTEGHIEQELTHGLGSLQILFHSFALVMQLLIASRIISSLGIVASLLLHPIVALLSLSGLFFRFGFTSAVLTKTNFEMTNIIHKNAYHTSYYAIQHKIREQVRELLEGFAQPIGALTGMFSLIILQLIFSADGYLYQAITILMIVVMAFMLFVLLKNETKYTHISVKNLVHSNNPILQLNAIEVLGQRGHKNATEILTRTLKDNDLEDKVKIKILETLAHMKDPNSIPEITDSLNSANKNVRIAALKAIEKFYDDKKIKKSLPFSSHLTNDILKNLFSKEEDSKVKANIISILAKLRRYETVPFLLDILKNADNRLKADCILVCRNFNDINIAHFLLPYLDSDDPKVKANTIAALWQFNKYRVKLRKALKKMIYSKDKCERMAGYWLIGDIKAVQEKNILKESLKKAPEDEKFISSIALAKLGCKDAIPYIVNALMSEDKKLKSFALNAQDKFPQSISNSIQKYIRQNVSVYINNILTKSNKTSVEELDRNTLIQLRNAYELVNEHEEVQNINDILKKQIFVAKSVQFNPT